MAATPDTDLRYARPDAASGSGRSPELSDQWPAFADALQLDGVLGALCNDDVHGVLARLGRLYEANRREPLRLEATIPPIIHQIWLGSPVPAELLRYSASWREHHPHWEFRLWTDREVAGLDFGTRDLFESASCWAQKSDLLRAELLHRFGGLYVDLDSECYRPIDELAAQFDFFGTLKNIFAAYVGWPAIWRAPITVCNSVFGARPGHPLMSAYLERVRARWSDTASFELKPGELPRMAIAALGGFARAAQIKDTGMRTFLPFAAAALDHVGQGSAREALLPPVFFNPVMPGARLLYAMPAFWERCRAAGIRWPKVAPYTRIAPHTYASHLSHNSWV
jgi:hypothetical protein